MSQLKKHKVVMLPTEKASIRTIMKYIEKMPLHDNLLDKNVGSLILNKNLAITSKNKYWTPQHLYILSDEEIKEGDWFFHCKRILKAEKAKMENYITFNNNSNVAANNCKKVIATTDTSIILPERFPSFTNLPQPSNSFIQKFIEEYNKGNIITDVMVEYEVDAMECTIERCDANPCINYKLKINKDNTITIRPTKNSWSREEVSKAIHDCLLLANGTDNIGRLQKFVDNWIKENL